MGLSIMVLFTLILIAFALDTLGLFGENGMEVIITLMALLVVDMVRLGFFI